MPKHIFVLNKLTSDLHASVGQEQRQRSMDRGAGVINIVGTVQCDFAVLIGSHVDPISLSQKCEAARNGFSPGNERLAAKLTEGDLADSDPRRRRRLNETHNLDRRY